MNMATISSLMLLAVLCAGLSEVKAATTAAPTPTNATESTTTSVKSSGGGGVNVPSVGSSGGTVNKPSNTNNQGTVNKPSNANNQGSQDSSTSTTVPTTTLSVEDKIAGWIPDLTCADKSCKQEFEAVKNVTKVKKDFCDAYDDYKKCFDDNSKTCAIKKNTLDDVNKFCSGCSLQASVVLFLVAIFASLM